MKNVLFSLLLLGASSLAAKADTLCSTANQDLTYKYDIIERGIPPRHGDLIFRETLLFGGNDYGVNEQFRGLDYRPKFSMKFDSQTKKVLSEVHFPGGSDTTYSIRIDSVKVGMPGLGREVVINRFVICTETMRLVP
jgi:hypothetical protein